MTKSRKANVLRELSSALTWQTENDSFALKFATDLAEAYGVNSDFRSHPLDGGVVLDYSDSSDQFRIKYLLTEILSKYSGHELGINTESVAWEKFHAAELVCRETNKRLRNPREVQAIACTCEPLLHEARKKIAKVLGEFHVQEMVTRSRYSNGATTMNSRRQGHFSFKFATVQHATLSAVSYVNAFRIASGRGIPTAKLTGFNKATTVPKNSKTDRSIAIEPGWNMFFQLGIGAMIRHRLLRVNIDLNDQTVNQQLASVGCSESLATVDLSSASDTISYELVRLLLPSDWFEALDALRSPRGSLPDGTYIDYEKFSSMGNGYTFELESLIFWALSKSVIDANRSSTSQTLSVYGDDIILPSDCVPLLAELFFYCGFTVNEKKSFSDGPFRESCGKHYHSGFDVSPFYIRTPIRSFLDMVLLLNNLYRWGTTDGVWDPRALHVYQKWVRKLPRKWQKIRIPDGFGDGALVGSTPGAYTKYVGGRFKAPIVQEVCRDVPFSHERYYLYRLFEFDTGQRGDPLKGASRSQPRPTVTLPTGRVKVGYLTVESFSSR